MDIVLSFTLLSTAVIALMIGISVMKTSEKNAKSNWHFLLLCSFSFVWNSSYAAMGLMKNVEYAYFMRSFMFIGLLGVLNMGAQLVCFWLNTNSKMKKIISTYSVVGSLLIYPVIISQESVYFIKTPYGTYYKFQDYIGRDVYNVFLVLFLLLMIGTTVYRIHKSYYHREKFMARTILICFLLICIGMLPDTLLPMLNQPVFPLSAFAQFICILLVYIVFIHYNVTKVTIRNVSEYVYKVVEVPVVVTGEHGRIEIINASASEFFALPTDQLIGTDIRCLFLLSSEVYDVYEQEGRKGVTIEARCMLNDARCSLSVSHIHDRYHERLGDIIVITDLTAKLEMIDQLNHSKKEAIAATEAKSVFLANMSHEIRTPMNAIIGMSEIILKREIPTELRDELMNIKNASEGLLAIINDILDFSKIESGRFEVIESEYDLSTMITEVVHMISIRLLDRSIYLFVDIQPDIPQKLIGDDIRIKQILMNILGNAVKFTKEGYIFLKLWMEETHEEAIILHMSVEDTGIGIKNEDISKLFGMFSQVDTMKNRCITGTGLGLAIVKNLVEMMGGEITVDSIYGTGTTFSWYLKQTKVASPAIYTCIHKEEWNVVLYEEDAEVARYMLKTLNQLKLKVQHWKEEKDFCLVPKGTYCILRRTLLIRYRHMVESVGFDSRIIAVMDVMSKKSSFMQYYQQVDMALLGLQLVDIINHREESRQLDKGSYDRNQVIPYPDASILIVDDNITNLLVAQGLIAPYRMHVDTCISGAQAILKVQERRYDLIFMDHMMPELDGIETMKRIRKLKMHGLQSLPIVALSANAMGNAKEYFMTAGFQDFLAKPIEFYQLNRILKTYLGKLQQGPLKNIATSKEGTIYQPLENSIEGIDMNAALWVLGGNQEAYFMILSTYFEDIKTRRRELPNLIEKREYHLITIYAHAIKSASKNVGAEKISQLAYELEIYGKEKQYERMLAKMDVFYKQLDQMIENLNLYFDVKIQEQIEKNVRAEKKEWMGELSREKKIELQKATEDMDYTIIEQILKDIKNYTYDTKTSTLLESLQEALGDYDYAQLESIAKKL